MQQRGFTLIELMASLAILTILGALSAPSLGGMLLKIRADSAISAMTADLALARITAISRGKAVTACPSRDAATCIEDGDWAEGWLVFVDANRSRRLDPGEQVLSTAQAKRVGSLTLRSTEGRSTLRYLPDGFGYGSNVTVSACLKGRVHARLIMNNAGRVRVERPSGAAPLCPTPARA